MTGPRTTRRRWLAGSMASVAGVVIAGSPEIQAQSQWIGEVPPAEYELPDRQFFLKVDLDTAVDGTLRALLAEISQALEEASVKVTWTGTKVPDYRFVVDDPDMAERALQVARLAVPGAEFEVAGAEIRVTLVDSLLERIRSDIVLKMASHLGYHERIVLRMNRDDVEGRRPEIRVYVHDSGCVRVDGIGRGEIPRQMMSRPHMELVPLYPTLDADSDHLPQGFSSFRIEREREATRPVEERKAAKQAEERLPEFRPQEPPLEALKRWKSTPLAEPQHWRRATQDRWRNIVGGKPIVKNSHFVSADMIQRAQGPAISLRLDVVGEARAGRLLPAFQGRQFGLVLDNGVVGRFNTVTLAGRGITLWPEEFVYEAELVADWLNGTADPPALEHADACPAAGSSL